MFSNQNSEFLIDWSFAWMLYIWGFSMIIEKYFESKQKYQMIGISLLLWSMLRITYAFNWVINSNSSAVYNIFIVIILLQMMMGILLLAQCNLYISFVTSTVIAILSWFLQHDGDYRTYCFVMDYKNPLRSALWILLSIMIFIAGVVTVMVCYGFYEILKEMYDERHKEKTNTAYRCQVDSD